MNPISHLDAVSMGEPAYLDAAVHLAQYLQAPTPALSWRIAQDYELAGDLDRARVWYARLARQAPTEAQAFASRAACRLTEIGEGATD